MFPTPFTLGIKRYQPEGSKDAHGNPVPGYADATDWAVHSIVPGAMAEPVQPNRDLSVIAWTILAPAAGDVPGERDLVVLDDVDYEVNARPGDFSRAAPWATTLTAPVVVELKRTEG